MRKLKPIIKIIIVMMLFLSMFISYSFAIELTGQQLNSKPYLYDEEKPMEEVRKELKNEVRKIAKEKKYPGFTEKAFTMTAEQIRETQTQKTINEIKSLKEEAVIAIWETDTRKNAIYEKAELNLKTKMYEVKLIYWHGDKEGHYTPEEETYVLPSAKDKNNPQSPTPSTEEQYPANWQNMNADEIVSWVGDPDHNENNLADEVKEQWAGTLRQAYASTNVRTYATTADSLSPSSGGGAVPARRQQTLVTQEDPVDINAEQIDIDPESYEPDSQTEVQHADRLKSLGNGVISIIGSIASGIAVITIIVLGIKYMLGSVEERAEYKKTMLPYVIGAVIVFATTVFISLIMKITGTILS